MLGIVGCMASRKVAGGSLLHLQGVRSKRSAHASKGMAACLPSQLMRTVAQVGVGCPVLAGNDRLHHGGAAGAAAAHPGTLLQRMQVELQIAFPFPRQYALCLEFRAVFQRV